jgi:hypothetical protein
MLVGAKDAKRQGFAAGFLALSRGPVQRSRHFRHLHPNCPFVAGADDDMQPRQKVRDGSNKLVLRFVTYLSSAI